MPQMFAAEKLTCAMADSVKGCTSPSRAGTPWWQRIHEMGCTALRSCCIRWEAAAREVNTDNNPLGESTGIHNANARL